MPRYRRAEGRRVDTPIHMWRDAADCINARFPDRVLTPREAWREIGRELRRAQRDGSHPNVLPSNIWRLWAEHPTWRVFGRGAQ
jgi:hypothetical protein